MQQAGLGYVVESRFFCFYLPSVGIAGMHCYAQLCGLGVELGALSILGTHSPILQVVLITLAFSSMKRTWSGVAWARHCRISARNWC